jgi:hypothetical protein
MKPRSWTALWLALCAVGTAAQERGGDGAAAYRCGPDGREYSASPCAEGKVVPVTDRRTEEQRRQAEEVARRERELAERLTREREQREKAAPAAVGIGSGAKAPARVAAGPKKSGRKKPKKPKVPKVPKGMKRTT